MRKLHRDLKAGNGWTANHNGPRGACCLTTYFIGQCVWTFRRAYVRWAKDRVAWARLHVTYDFTEGAANEEGIAGLLQATDYLPEDASLMKFIGDFEDILEMEQPETQAVVRMTLAGFSGAEIADQLNTSHGAVRNRITRFRTALYEAARERRIWIPEQLHTNPSASRPRNQRGGA
ncbi:sigma factor-like helix-turn-helix DNA-binding protein [Streptomyces sp. NPDC002187]|uniref:sigma factor-like helix-turn-helix DNA-binding protein n=1 Tax=Streptomyces sp. NPDC002187 TaxID=3364637 RepID=UPI00368209FA